MANIIYGVCGEGMGHAIRSKPVIEHLLKKHDVKIFSSGCAYHYLIKQFKEIYEVEGLFIKYKKNGVDALGTVKCNISRGFGIWKSLKHMRKFIKRFKPDIVISDYEAITAHAAKLERVPLISIDNQHIYSKTKLNASKKYIVSYLEAFFVNKLIMPAANMYFIMTFFYPPLNHSNVKLIPPVLREAICNAKPRIGKHILVYQSSSTNIRLLNILKSIKYEFIIYGFNMNKKEDNLTFREFNEIQYIHDLTDCRAIIMNGGFSLMAEGLHLGKPILSIPLERQFEQIVNAYYLEKLGYGKYALSTNREEIVEFIARLNQYKLKLAGYSNRNNLLYRELENIIDNSHQ